MIKYGMTVYDDEFMLWDINTYENIFRYYGNTVDWNWISNKLQQYLPELDNSVEVFIGCSSKTKQKLEQMLLENEYIINKKDILVQIDREKQLLLWQNELNKLGFLTKIENNTIIVVDKI